MQAIVAPRIATLDILRLFAALAVVGYHYFFRAAAGSPILMDVEYPAIAPFAIYGYLGVNLFFLISGYVIAWSAEGRTAIEFAVARFVRIYPGFVVCMTISALVLVLAADPQLPASLGQYIANLAIFSPALGQPFIDGVYWSIVLELVFYGWVAIAIVTGVFASLRLEFIAAMLIASAINEGFVGSGALRLVLLTDFAPLFALGMLTQYIHSRGVSPESMLLAIAAFALTFANATIGRDWMAAHYGVALPNDALIIANAANVALFLAALAVGPRVGSSAVTIAIGGLTYPLYLLHQHIGYVAIPKLAPWLGTVGAAFAVIGAMLIASWLVWRLVERPVQPVLKRLLTRFIDKAIAIAGRARPASLPSVQP